MLAVAAVQALITLTAEIGQVILVRRHLKMRQLAFAEGEFHLTAHGDIVGVFQRLRITLEYLSHFFLGFEVEFVGLELHSVGIVQCAVGLDTEQETVRLAVLLLDIMAVVGRDKPDADLVGDTD